MTHQRWQKRSCVAGACRRCVVGTCVLFTLSGLIGYSLLAQQLTNGSLQSALADFAKVSRRIPFKTVVHATTGHRVLNFDTNNPTHVALRKKILHAAALAGQRARKEGLVATRANEAGNHIESFVRTALREAELDARVPINAMGRAQNAGYPDIEVTGPAPCYIELKTYSSTTANTTQRSFYYSPSESPKVTRDAVHFLLAYELQRETREGRTCFVPVHWRLLTLENLEVDLKFEFNQSNRGLYSHTNAVINEAAVDEPQAQ